MDDPDEAARVIANGTWLYDSAVPFPVSIVAFPFDYWLEVGPADYEDAPVEPTPIGPDGHLYYVSFGARRVDSPGYASIEEAKAEAQRRVPSVIAWG
ncbi:hypothetical protein [Candidatus Viadribacter manganicus]|uniref:Uncharacterized protein n=1 Tax=Candidatus Viadribacter manganicus TaxID=1759059 RepID=A0A1B1AH83_9PROT|nr:hypothetical protein [Candidatus Viadribacter manganicus]ANP45901.1 hypothetical protein ATE48_08185 [Candidatus Viadribacter manganicus]